MEREVVLLSVFLISIYIVKKEWGRCKRRHYDRESKTEKNERKSDSMNESRREKNEESGETGRKFNVRKEDVCTVIWRRQTQTHLCPMKSIPHNWKSTAGYTALKSGALNWGSFLMKAGYFRRNSMSNKLDEMMAKKLWTWSF